MDLRRLAYFVAVAEEQHFGRAAERLHISGPPLSQRIRELEAELGLTLFERSSRRVNLTAAGQRLLPEARAVLAAAERFAATAADVAARRVGGAGRGVAFAVAYCYGAEHLTLAAARRLRDAHPEVAVRPVAQTSLRALDDVRAGRLHAAVVRPPVGPVGTAAGPHGVPASALGAGTDPVVEHRLLARVPCDHVAVPAGHRLAGRATVHGRDLDGEEVLLVDRNEGPSYHDALVAYCRAVGAAPRWVLHPASQVERMLDLVAVGSAIGWINAWQAADVRRDGVVIVPLEPVARHDEFHLVWRVDDDDAAMTAAFAAIAADVFAVAAPVTGVVQ